MHLIINPSSFFCTHKVSIHNFSQNSTFEKSTLQNLKVKRWSANYVNEIQCRDTRAWLCVRSVSFTSDEMETSLFSDDSVVLESPEDITVSTLSAHVI